MTWVCVWYVACGGLLVGMVIKHVSGIMKDITLGFSILLAAAGSMFLFEDVQLNAGFLCGSCLVVSSVVLYGKELAWFADACARVCALHRSDARGRYGMVPTSEDGT